MNILCRLGWHRFEDKLDSLPELFMAMPPMPLEYGKRICCKCGKWRHITYINGEIAFVGKLTNTDKRRGEVE